MKQAMIFAAGLGTRLRPLTDTMPKALVPVGGKPLLWHVIGKLKAAGFERIVVNVHHFAQQITDYLRANNNFGLDVRISDETGGLLETGGGIKKALPLFDPESPILIHNVDILSNVDLTAFHQYHQGKEKNSCAATLLVSERKTRRYLLFDEDLMLTGWTSVETGEVRSPVPGLRAEGLRHLAFSGIHLISPSLFPCFAEMPERFSIIDFYLRWCCDYSIRGFWKKDLQLMDVGKLDTLDQAEIFIESVRPESNAFTS